MKLAATATAHVIEAVANLPGVATLDFADRAAAAMTRLTHPSSAAVMIGTLDQRGFITSIETTGAALSVGGQDDAQVRAEIAYIRPAGASASSRGLEVLRNSYRLGDWIGWSVGAGKSENMFFSAQQLGLLKRAESPVWQRWHGQMPTGGLQGHGAAGGWLDVFAGIAPVPSSEESINSRRVVLAEIAVGPGSPMDATRANVVLDACMPLLSSRILRAIGATPTVKSDWLTPREEMVLWHLLSGKKVPEIAKALDRSVYTVHDHVKSLHRKLGANNRGQLVARALGHLGPLSPDDGVEVMEVGEGHEEPGSGGGHGHHHGASRGSSNGQANGQSNGQSNGHGHG
jgi:DNA-binding CsgD family transcriptional regulator